MRRADTFDMLGKKIIEYEINRASSPKKDF